MLKLLNDDCLVEIFQYLDLREQLNLALLDERFRPLIVERVWRKFHIFKHFPSSMLTLEEFRMFFPLLAPHLTEITLDAADDYFSEDYEFYFSLEYPELRKLYLCGGSFRNDYLMGIARTSPKLELLALKSSGLTGEYLCDFPNLQTLFLTTSKLEPIYLEKVFEKEKITHVRLEIDARTTNKQDFNRVIKAIFPKITKLVYIDNPKELVGPSVYNSSAHLFQNLQILHASDCRKSTDFVCSLHTLRELHLDACRMQQKDLFKVIENNLHLEHLYMYEGLMYDEDALLNGGEEILFRQHLKAHGVCKIADIRRQQQKNEPCKLLLHLHLYEPEDLQLIVKECDSNRGHQEPAIKIVEQPFPDGEDVVPERNFLEFMLKWN